MAGYMVYCYNILLGVHQSIQSPISTAASTSSQSLLSNDQQDVSTSTGGE